MNTNFSRRDFIKKSAWGAATTFTLPAFLQQTLFDLDARAQTLPPQGEEGPILLIMELGGGNDALNTVIPFSNSIYTGARPTLKLGEAEGVLPIGTGPNIQGGNEDLALHPNLASFHDLWNSGEMAIINGVGYPNPNLSHFTSFDFWHSAEPNSVAKSGWVGRYFDSQCNGCEATQAIELANRPTLALKSSAGLSPSVTFNDPEAFAWKDLTTPGREVPLEDLFRKLIGLDHPSDGGIDTSNESLAYVQRAAHNAMISTANVRQANLDGGDLLYQDWPGSRLSRDLQLIAQLIKGNVQTSIFYAHQGGYDTHNNQILNDNPLTGRHFTLLRDLNGALGAFAEEMKLQGKWDRVLIMTFSEFGRKVIQNGSGGTDHGAAESMFMMGGQVKGGQFYGKYPDLSEQARVKRHSMDHNVDFRTVYRSVLENWMQVPASAMDDIFPLQPSPEEFQPIPFV